MTPDELATYLAGAGLGLTVDVNLFKIPFPPEAPTDQVAVCLVEFGSGPQEGSVGASKSALDAERPQVKVIVRGPKLGAQAARQKAHDVWKALRRLGQEPLSGVVYFDVQAESPQWLGPDENELPRYHFDLDVLKQESP